MFSVWPLAIIVILVRLIPQRKSGKLTEFMVALMDVFSSKFTGLIVDSFLDQTLPA